MGRCPVIIGTNVPNIHGFYSSIFLKQLRTIKNLQCGMRYINIIVSQCGMEGSVILFIFPPVGLDFSFLTSRLLVKGVVRYYRKNACIFPIYQGLLHLYHPKSESDNTAEYYQSG